MLPKRKFIKKQHRRQEEEEAMDAAPPTSLLERLHSSDPNHIEEALAYISSMCLVEDTPGMVPLIAELVSILHKGPTANVYQCLFALANLIDIEPRLVPGLFQLGLSKALTQLNSADTQLLRPILALMTSLHGNLPEEFRFLEGAVEQSLSIAHL
jgi:hypothetical protein